MVAGTGLVMRYSMARLFRFWLARLVAEHSQQTDRTVDALGRIETALGRVAGLRRPSSFDRRRWHSEVAVSRLVTGAGSGMGRLAARRLAADGIEVAAVDVDADGLAETGDLSPTISPLVCDVTDDGAVDELVGWVEPRSSGRSTGWSRRPGSRPTAPLVDQPVDTILRVMDVNYGGVVRVVKAALPAMLERGTGEVVVFASLAGWMPTPSLGAYSRHQARARRVLRGAGPRAPRHRRAAGLRVPAARRHADDPPARGRRRHRRTARSRRSRPRS